MTPKVFFIKLSEILAAVGSGLMQYPRATSVLILFVLILLFVGKAVN